MSLLRQAKMTALLLRLSEAERFWLGPLLDRYNEGHAAFYGLADPLTIVEEPVVAEDFFYRLRVSIGFCKVAIKLDSVYDGKVHVLWRTSLGKPDFAEHASEVVPLPIAIV